MAEVIYAGFSRIFLPGKLIGSGFRTDIFSKERRWKDMQRTGVINFKQSLTVLLAFFAISNTALAQDDKMAYPLSLEECLIMGIESNYGVQIARTNRKIAENNVTYAGFLPSLTASARQNQSILDSRSRSRDASVPDDNNDYTTNSLNADLTVSWTLFDGMSMFAEHNVQKELLKRGELNLRNSVEGLINDISQQYYYIITQTGKYQAAKTYLEISTVRYKQAYDKRVEEVISGLELTQARLDYNADSSQLVHQEQLLKNAYVQLYQMMNIDLESNYFINDTIILRGDLVLDDLLESARENNTSILLARRGEAISELDLKIARSDRYPSLSFTGGYELGHNDNSSSALKFTRTKGFRWGLSLSANLFDGYEVNRRIRNAKLSSGISEMQTREMELLVESDIVQSYNTYRNNLLMINFEIESAKAAYENLEIAMLSYQIGTMSNVEFREIQRSYLQAEERKLNAMYEAKISEIWLKYLAGVMMGD